MIRQCGNCTACCEGWLTAEIYGVTMKPGTPCQYLNKKCTIYDKRPANPCQGYNCAWLEGHLPLSLKPNFVGLIVSRRIYKDIEYYEVTEAGKKMTVPVLNEIIQWTYKNKKNLLYRVYNQPYTIGTEEFINLQDEIVNDTVTLK